MIQQNGPFIIPPGQYKPVLNQHALNLQANVLYLQAPSGVGFSINDVQGVQQINDQTTTHQLMDSLRLFFSRHVSLKGKQLYISGSGYGAVYAVKLARHIIDINNDDSIIYNTKINIKGLALGNPCIFDNQCYGSGSQRKSNYHYQFLYTRGFISKSMYDIFLGKCMIDSGYQCYLQRQNIDKFVKQTSISLYNVYSKCYASSSNTIDLGCQDQSGAIGYFNDEHFKQNWNIKSNKTWQPCNKDIYHQYITSNGVFHLINGLVKDNIRIWVYSGDMDSTVPIIGTKTWIDHYRRHYQVPTKKLYRQWWIHGRHQGQDQIGGFIWELKDLTFISIKGAGFKAGLDQPQATQKMFNAFITQGKLY